MMMMDFVGGGKRGRGGWGTSGARARSRLIDMNNRVDKGGERHRSGGGGVSRYR